MAFAADAFDFDHGYSARLFDRFGFAGVGGRRDETRQPHRFDNSIRKSDSSDLMRIPNEMQRPQLTLECSKQLPPVILISEQGAHDLIELRVTVIGERIDGTELEIPSRTMGLTEAVARHTMVLVFTPRAGADLTKKLGAGDERHFKFLEGGA